jgi:hypothetical protein
MPHLKADPSAALLRGMNAPAPSDIDHPVKTAEQVCGK